MGRVITTNVKRAFTILELLCVIVIIFLLLGLLLPALARLRMSATYRVCGSYLAQYTKAGLRYLEDNDGLFPDDPNEWLYSNKSTSKEHPIGCRWHDGTMSPRGEIMQENVEYRGKMWNYFHKTGIHPCPIFRDLAKYKGCENSDHNKEIEIIPQYSYTMNGYLGSKGDGGISREPEVRNPSKVFFFAEENSWSVRPDHPKYPAEWLRAPLSTRALDDTVLLITPIPEAKDCFATYHNATSENLNNGFGNVAFIDGHVERIRSEDQLRKTMHGGKSSLGPAGNLFWAWASKSEPPGGWNTQ